MGSAKKAKILCVDDEPNILRTLQRFFLKTDYDNYTSESAVAALSLLEAQGPVNLIISDFRMPGMNGIEFLNQVHLRYPATIGILLSGYSDLSMVSSALDEQLIFRNIAKPWNRQDLRQAVRDALQVQAGQEHVCSATSANEAVKPSRSPAARPSLPADRGAK